MKSFHNTFDQTTGLSEKLGLVRSVRLPEMWSLLKVFGQKGNQRGG